MGRYNKPTDVFRHINMSPVPPSTCWLWTASVSDKGLPYFQYNKRKLIAYRLVYWLTHPEFDIENTRMIIRHKCMDENGQHTDNPLCCNPAHMEVGTHRDNMNDMMLRGRKGHTREVIEEILRITREAPGLTHSQIAKYVSDKHSVRLTRTTVTDVLNGYRRRVLRDAIDQRHRDIEDSGKQ
jgi:hypothetical protein